MRSICLPLFALAGLAVGASGQPSEATRRLAERNKMFEPKVTQVADNVYTATGYQVTANSMIVGDDGVVIVDPGQAPPLAQPVRDEFEKITNKPVKAIIYTHAHGDHVNGAAPFFSEGVQVWARSNFGSEAARNAQTGLTGGARPVNTQGFDLPLEQRMGIGVAIPPNRRPQGNMMRDGAGPARRQGPPPRVEPTHTFSTERKTITVAGITLDLVSAPGETDDQLFVWYPDKKVLFAGDNFYQSWPNVYPLRGTARRSTRDWIASLTKMIEEEPRHLVGGHTTPMLNNAVEVLTNYRDALKYVHDKTIEGAAKYLTPDELVEYAALPEKYAKLDYLADYYGSVWGTIRDIYAQDLGWFDGDPLNLHRESPKQQSQRMADLVGGVDELMGKARAAMEAGDELGAAQLAQHAMRLRPDDPAPKLLMADALAVIGERTFNAPARNYTLAYSNRLRREAQGN